jgi:hypothetical protein
MKETQPLDTPESDKIIISQDVKKQITLIGSQRKIKGLTMFEFNPVALTLEPASFKESTVSITGKRVVDRKIVHKLIYKEGYVYVQALNKKNAYKQIAKSYSNFKQK